MIKVLVCDDDDDVVKVIQYHLADIRDEIDLTHTKTRQAAEEALRESFFHIALVDRVLVIGGAAETEGTRLFSYIDEHAPSCKKVLITKFGSGPGQALGTVVGFSENRPFLLNKEESRTLYYLDLIRGLFQAQLRRTWSIVNLSHLVEEVVQRRSAIQGLRSSSDAVCDEIESLLFALFDQSASMKLATGSSVQLVIDEFKTGRSGSTTAVAHLSYGEDANGSEIRGRNCVVKIGPRESIANEAYKYHTHVKLGVPIEFRVELLGHASADSLGGVCYSFAGGDGSRTTISTFDEILDSGAEDRAAAAIETLFDPDERRWHEVVGQPRPIPMFYATQFGTNYAKVIEEVHRFARSEKLGLLNVETGVLKSDPYTLKLPPAGLLGQSQFQWPEPTCLVHGDLHGGNVMFDKNDRAYLVDFANAGIGPRFADATALASTVRLRDFQSKSAMSELVNSIDRLHRAEIALVRSGPINDHAAAVHGAMPWFRLARLLNEQAILNVSGRKSDDSHLDGPTPEFLKTQLLYALSTFRIRWLTRPQKLRLIIWMSALIDQLDVESRSRA